MESQIESLLEKITIKFPKPLSVKATKKMLRDITKERGYRLSMAQSGFFNYDSHKSEDYISSLSGNITRLNPFSSVSLSFNIAQNIEYLPIRFDSARFFTTPGYDWEEIPEHERELITNLRKEITYYLSNPKK